MDVANEFRINCLRRSKYQNEVFIKNVVCQTIEAIPLNTNDNAIQVRLSFNISVILEQESISTVCNIKFSLYGF